MSGKKTGRKSKNGTKVRSSSSPVAEAIDAEIFLQPWYLSCDTFLAIRRLLPSAQLLKMRYYFDDYGCLKCGKGDRVYGSNGMCARCAIVVRARVIGSLKRRFEKVGVAIADRPIQLFLGGRTKRQINRLAGPLLSKGQQKKARRSPR